jgi:hypothetical protein
MKIKKIYERNSILSNVEEGFEEYAWYGESILKHFFKGIDYGNTEILDNDENSIALTIEFIVDDLDVGLFMKVSEYLSWLTFYGRYKFSVIEASDGNPGILVLETILMFKNLKKLEEELTKLVGYYDHPTTKKYNL